MLILDFIYFFMVLFVFFELFHFHLSSQLSFYIHKFLVNLNSLSFVKISVPILIFLPHLPIHFAFMHFKGLKMHSF